MNRILPIICVAPLYTPANGTQDPVGGCADQQTKAICGRKATGTGSWRTGLLTPAAGTFRDAILISQFKGNLRSRITVSTDGPKAFNAKAFNTMRSMP